MYQARCGWCQRPFVKWHERGLSCWVCPTAKCRQKQMKWAIAATSHGEPPQCLYVPLPKQVDASMAVLSGKYRWILYGGARGGAKSHFLRWLGYRLCLQYQNFQAVLLRRTYPELEKSHMRRVNAEVLPLGATYVPSARPPVVKFANKSVLEFGHCADPQDVDNYLSAEYHLVMPDELGTFPEDTILKLGSSARLHAHGYRPCVVGSTNPGAAWVRDRWITKGVDPDRYPNYNPDDYFFIQSLLDDNPYPDPEYERFLDALDPATKAAWRFGSWDVFEGQYFTEFRKDLHVRQLEIPPDIPMIGGFDWGYAAPGVHLWAVVLPEGHLHLTQEYKFHKTVAQDAGEEIVRQTKQQCRPLIATYADPSMWIRSGQSGESIAETCMRTGVPMVRARHERVNGWQRLRHWLRVNPATGVPWLTIEPSCTYLLRTFPTLVHDATHPEDVDTTGPDHAADALRYLVMGRPAPMTRITEPTEPVPDSAGRLFRDALSTQQPIMGSDRVVQ